MRSLLLCILIVFSSAANAQQATRNPQAPSAQDNLLGFVGRNASAAGAAAICKPELYTEIRLCTVLIVLHWEAMGQVAPHDNSIKSIIEKTWNQASGNARNLQASANAPMTCENVVKVISNDSGFWQTCSAARAIQERLDAEKAKNKDTRPGNR